MTYFSEKRDSFRIKVNSAIQCRCVGTHEFSEAVCTSLSGNGLSFTMTQHIFCINDKVEIVVIPEVSADYKASGFMQVIRVVVHNPQTVEIAGILISPEEAGISIQ